MVRTVVGGLTGMIYFQEMRSKGVLVVGGFKDLGERSPLIGNAEMIQIFDSTIAMIGLPQRYTSSFFHGIDSWCLSTSMLFTLYAYLPSKNSSKLVNHMAKLFDSVISRDYEMVKPWKINVEPTNRPFIFSKENDLNQTSRELWNPAVNLRDFHWINRITFRKLWDFPTETFTIPNLNLHFLPKLGEEAEKPTTLY